MSEMNTENNDQEKDLNSDIEKETTDVSEDAAKEVSEEKGEKDNKKTLYIIEALIAVFAIAVIVICVVFLSKKNNEGEGDVSGNTASQGQIGTVSGDVPGADGAPAVYDTDISAINTITESEAEARVSDGTMMRIDTADGNYVYVINLDDTEYLKSQINVTDEELEDYIYADLMQYYTEDPGDRTVCQKYDTVSINFAGYLDGEPFEGGSADDQQVALGAGNFIPGFEEGIIGMEVGEVKDITVTFPEDYGAPDLAGKEAVFTITLNEIVSQVSELTDEIVATHFTDITTADECRDYYKSLIIEEQVYGLVTKEYYVNQISEETVKTYYDSTYDYYMSMAQMYGTDLDTLLSYYGQTTDTFLADLMESAKTSACVEAIYNAIGENYGITVDDTEVQELATQYGYEDVQSFYDDYGESTIQGYLLDQKVLEYVTDLAK